MHKKKHKCIIESHMYDFTSLEIGNFYKSKGKERSNKDLDR